MLDTPWNVCKVGFTFARHEEVIWAALWPQQDSGYKLPPGWKFEGTGESEGRNLAVFKVTGPVTELDGLEVRQILDLIEAT